MIYEFINESIRILGIFGVSDIYLFCESKRCLKVVMLDKICVNAYNALC